MIPTLRDYQVDLIGRVRARLAEGVKRVVLQSPVGSGKTSCSSEIFRLAVAKGKRCLFLAHKRRLIKQKSDRLADFEVPHGILMRGMSPRPTMPVQVASRDTFLSRVNRNDWIAPPPADVVVIDEAHVALKEYETILEMYPSAVILGLTATPAQPDGKTLWPFYQTMECAVSVKTLVSQGWLTPVRCYAPQMVKQKGKRQVAGDPVSQWLRLGENRPTVLFASKVMDAQAVCNAFNVAGVKSEHIDATTDDDEREAIIYRVKIGETKVLTSCGVLTEGVDIPCLSCAILLRLAGSVVTFIQAVGRIMRAFPGKKDAILLDHSDATLEHGFPDEDQPWSLDESDTVDHRKKKAQKEKPGSKPICCPNCGLMYSGTIICPACDYRLPKKLIPPALKAHLLSEVDRVRDASEMAEVKKRYWHMCLGTMASKGRTAGAAAHMFKSRFREWPPDTLPNVPRGEEWRRKVEDLYPQYLAHK